MRLMKMFFAPFLAICAVFAFGASASMAATGAGWSDDYEGALARAKAEKKLVFLEFTGSDWCPICTMLDKEVLSKQEFKDYASQNLVLVELDFPQFKTQPQKLMERNEKLRQKYDIPGFPIVVVLNSAGKRIATLNYEPGGVQPFLAKLSKLKGK